MPIDSEAYSALLARCKAAIDEGRNPVAMLTGEEQETLQTLHNEDVGGAATLLAILRDYAENHPNEALRWTPREVSRLNFNPYVAAARIWRQDMARARRNATNVIEMAGHRGGRARGALAQLDPNVMVTMGSPRLRGVGLLRQHRQGRIWYDEFYRRVYFDWNGTDDGRVIETRALNDELIRAVALWLVQTDDKLGAITFRQAKEWVETMADMDKRNAARDWLNTLTWDGTERLRDVLVRGFGAVDSEFNINAGRCWFVGMVARIMRPGCQLDTMPVLIGPQGIFKSQALRIIGGDWYRSAVSDIQTKDFKQELNGAVVFEIPELHSLVTSNAAAAKVKAVISNQVDHYRPPYGSTVEEFRRTAVMVGTTNNRDWHHDESGGRRFWPIHCGDIDLEWLRDNRAQLFAEARNYFDLPMMSIPMEGDDHIERRDPRSMWWNVPVLAQRELMEAETAEDSWETIIVAQLQRTDHLRPLIYGRDSDTIVWHDGTLKDTTDWGNLLTTTRIAFSWLALNSEQAGRRVTSNRIGSIMRNLGWSRTQQRLQDNMRTWIWRREFEAPPVVVATAEEDTEIPF